MNALRPLLTAAVLACAATCAAQPAPPSTQVDDSRDTVHALRLQPGERIPLDGMLDHPAWQRARPHNSFIARDPTFGTAPPQRTEFRVLFDEQALYVGITAHDSAPEQMRGPIVRADQVNRTQDFVVVYIDAIGSKRSAQFFRLNAAGSTADGLHTAADDNEDFAPDFDWDGAVSRHVPGVQGWTAVFRLPFASLRFAPGTHDWRILVARRMPREQFHMMTSAPIPRDVPNFIHTMQPLRGVAIPQDSQFLTLRPSLTLRRDRASGPDAPPRDSRPWDASLDLKWRPRAELVVDGTLNPDFSQLALDVPQLAGNSKFALFLAEKRPFFFESADLLRSPTEAFYTRSYTQPRWGLRATWRDTNWAGSAFTLNDKGGGLVLLPGTYGTDFAAQPASLAAAVRARSDSADGQWQWGGLAATRRYADGGGENLVLGPDVHGSISGGWRLRAQWLGSQTSAQPDADGVLRQSSHSRSGQKRHLRALYQGGDVEADLTYDDTSPGFRHDSGFVNQAGVRRVHGWFSRVVARDTGWFDEVWVNAEAEAVTDWQGGPRQGQSVFSMWRPGIWTRGDSGLEWWFETYSHSMLRTAAGAPLLGERFLASGFSYTPAAWFPLLEGKLIAGRVADTTANQVRPGGNTRWAVKLRPLARLELEATVSGAWLRHQRQLAYREMASQLLGVWHFDARHSLRGIVQRTTLDRRAEPGVDASRQQGDVASLTYTWRESVGTLLYLGASSGRQVPLASATTRTREVFVKLQLDVDEARRLWRGRTSSVGTGATAAVPSGV